MMKWLFEPSVVWFGFNKYDIIAGTAIGLGAGLANEFFILFLIIPSAFISTYFASRV